MAVALPLQICCCLHAALLQPFLCLFRSSQPIWVYIVLPFSYTVPGALVPDPSYVSWHCLHAGIINCNNHIAF